MRAGYEAQLMALLREGIDAGALDIADIPVTAFAMLAILVRICRLVPAETAASARRNSWRCTPSCS